MCSKTGLEELVPEDGCCGGWGGVGGVSGLWTLRHTCVCLGTCRQLPLRDASPDSNDLDCSWLIAGSSWVSHLTSGRLRYRRDKMGTKASNYRLAVRIK